MSGGFLADSILEANETGMSGEAKVVLAAVKENNEKALQNQAYLAHLALLSALNINNRGNNRGTAGVAVAFPERPTRGGGGRPDPKRSLRRKHKSRRLKHKSRRLKHKSRRLKHKHRKYKSRRLKH